MRMKQRSYTLVEILMVAGMIALIAALILVTYNGVYRSWSTGNTVAAMKGAHLALDRYMLEHGSYPVCNLTTMREMAAAVGDAKLTHGLLQDCSPYSKKYGTDGVIIFDDFGDKKGSNLHEIKYIYTPSVNGLASFVLISAGRDGVFGSDEGDDVIYLPSGNSTLKPGFYTGSFKTGTGEIEDAEPIAQ